MVKMDEATRKRVRAGALDVGGQYACRGSQGGGCGAPEPVFANIRHRKRMSRFALRGKTKVATQWQLDCLVHNIEKIATQAMRAH